MFINDKWINKIMYIHLIEYLPAVTRDAAVGHATTWGNPEKLCYMKGDSHTEACSEYFHLLEMSRINTFTKAEW